MIDIYQPLGIIVSSPLYPSTYPSLTPRSVILPEKCFIIPVDSLDIYMLLTYITYLPTYLPTYLTPSTNPRTFQKKKKKLKRKKFSFFLEQSYLLVYI